MQTHLADAGPLNATDPWNERKPLGQPRTIGLDVDHVTAAEDLPAKLGHRAHQRNAAAGKQRDAIAHALHAFEQMRGEQHRNAFGFEAADDGQQFRSRVRVEPGCRLVENGDLRALHEDFGQAEALSHAAGEGADAFVGGFGEADPLERVGYAFLAFVLFEADQAGSVTQIVGSGQLIVEADRIRQITDPAFDRKRLARRVESEHAHLTTGNLGQPEQHQDRGRLAGTVRSEQPENLPAPDGKGDVIDGNRLPVALGETLGLDNDVRAHRRPNLATAPTMTSSAMPMMPTPAIPHIVEVVTVTRKVVDADSPRADARMVVT